jgi:hypothetical protein
VNHDDLEIELGDAMHRATGAVSSTSPAGGRDLIGRRVRQRANRRRRNLGVGAVAAVAVLAGGVIALRPDPPQHLSFASSPGSASGSVTGAASGAGKGVATGYATGSMSGMPTGWNTPTADPTTVALPKVIAQLDSSWTPDSVYASSISQGSGTPAAPMAVLADQSGPTPRFVAVSVQTATTLGPGHGGQTFSSNGLTGRIISDNANGVEVIADVPGGHRVQAFGVGVDRPTLLALIATLHQDGTTWALNASGGLTPVATTTPTSTNRRNLDWSKTVTPGADPQTAPTKNVSVQVTSGGAYEFYGEATQNGTNAFTATSSLTTVLGHRVVASAVSTMKGSVQTLLLDDQGLVYNITQVDPTATGAIAPPTLVLATDADWSSLITTAATNQAKVQDQAIAAKKAAVDKARGVAGAVATDPASGYKPVGDSTVTPPTAPPTSDSMTTTTVAVTPASTPGTP